MIKNQHFLQFKDLTKNEIEHIFDRTLFLKKQHRSGKNQQSLSNKTLVLIFEKHSTRTRLSFEVGMQQMGGNTVFLNNKDSQLGRGEPVEDAARVISRMCDSVMIRTFEQSVIEKFANYSQVPVINGLTNDHHPCQILADVYTFQEKKGSIENKTIAWIGDSNNVFASWVQASSILGFNLHVSSPPGYEGIFNKNNQEKYPYVKRFNDPKSAANGAHLILTDIWTSMGFESESAKRLELFQNWQVNERVMSAADDEALFIHCLPAHRGEEVTREVLEGRNSAVWEEAENRLHTQKALLETMLTG